MRIAKLPDLRLRSIKSCKKKTKYLIERISEEEMSRKDIKQYKPRLKSVRIPSFQVRFKTKYFDIIIIYKIFIESNYFCQLTQRDK